MAKYKTKTDSFGKLDSKWYQRGYILDFDAENLFQFRWRRPVKGFYLTRAKAVSGDIAQFFVMKPGEEQTYFPLESADGLFRTFAAASLQPNGDASALGIGSFLKFYGPLAFTHIEGLSGMVAEKPGKQPTRLVLGQAVRGIQYQVVKMRAAVELFDAIRENNVDFLSRRIRWQGDCVQVGYPDLETAYLEGEAADKALHEYVTTSLTNLASPAIKPEIHAQMEHGDLLLPARLWLQQLVNEYLSAHVAPRVLFHHKDMNQALFMVPSNLLGAMWLQLAQAIDGGNEYRKCAVCPRWFQVTRKDRQFCSKNCKVKASRQRGQ